MNPHAAQPTSPAALGKNLWRNRQLILQMTRRDVLGRYKGSFMGLVWSFFTPLFMLAVYIWFQKTGKGFADGVTMQAEVHWYEAHGIGKVNLKVKEWL